MRRRRGVDLWERSASLFSRFSQASGRPSSGWRTPRATRAKAGVPGRAGLESPKSRRTLASATRDSASPIDMEAVVREAASGREEPVREAPREQAPPSRAGRKSVVGYLSHNQWRQLRYITIDGGTTMQARVFAALEDLLLKKRSTQPEERTCSRTYRTTNSSPDQACPRFRAFSTMPLRQRQHRHRRPAIRSRSSSTSRTVRGSAAPPSDGCRPSTAVNGIMTG